MSKRKSIFIERMGNKVCLTATFNLQRIVIRYAEIGSIDRMTHICSQQTNNLVDRNWFGMLNWFSVQNLYKLRFRYTEIIRYAEMPYKALLLNIFNE